MLDRYSVLLINETVRIHFITIRSFTIAKTLTVQTVVMPNEMFLGQT